MDIRSRIAELGTALTPAERKVANTLLADPQGLAYQTVSAIAAASNTGAASVVRLANKLGFEGFSALQAAAQAELSERLLPAAIRIRERSNSPTLDRHIEIETSNVARTVGGAESTTVTAAVERLSAAGSQVYVLSGDASRGIAAQFVHDLGSLRPGVWVIDGNPVAVQRTLAGVQVGDVVVAIDLRRYDRWVVEAAGTTVEAGAWCLAVTDSVISPIAAVASAVLTVSADSEGPFDSHVGTLALLNLLVAGVASKSRRAATKRLERAEHAWRVSDALIDQ
jgi:DNA-binding MurR/RpiR family transcriptional regulator